ncbi:putative lipoate-protein ligase B [Prochlorococcus marinus str. MIT 9515]|uniref:Octanoyltransferase n=1 Tax=Prochlorococcus marinus (strain MIT 9515) TaxID=167542 RepID=LIPB_PROM5|nr:lipoyl(octanoyl) transferase LipB [Prochlorococcus marinus]A2BV61.1 RecName: Full=Octanoyltransferase; AltName: Full=Lipoate-protein ligase B; AltName: Full=Lipoyl/octanoyl transferase; AltName: Full=Octanoyl-[acyl-carrier-protein]-protein N-octanoyltransferase [Prochlorococcus marinus str. MIT 9515]ABM71672.1 putative lipoate-protein ligase B [Prochlorococcus marinus str. MIT 9515]
MINRTSIIKQPDKISSFCDVYKLQKKYQDALISGKSNIDFIWLGEHQLCYTIGRGSNMGNLLFSLDEQDVFKIDRGGEVTCHMPGQLVTYLVLDLHNFNKDLNWYLRKIEKIIIKVLSSFNIDSSTKDGFTGVWTGERKIASIGIGCKRWVTIHGFSINVNCKLENFDKIVPCGIQGCQMANMSDYKKNLDIKEVKIIVKKIIQEEFYFNFISE